MKNKTIRWPIIVVVCCAIICCLVYFININWNRSEPLPVVEKFNLESELYSGSELKEISAEEFDQLVKNKKSFVVIAHMDFCPAETPLTSTAEQLVLSDGYTFYGLKSDIFKASSLAKKITYLPSAAIYHNGELVKYLDAESDDDIKYYQSADELRNWLDNYINLKEEKDNVDNL